MTDTPAPPGQRILVIDDEPDIVALIVYHLAKAGYRVSTAATGSDGLEAARREHPALIILDLMLPGLSGYDVLEQLRAAEPTKGVGVLMLTARVEEPDRVRGLALGADNYLTKPFSPQELVLRVAAILRRMATQASTPSDVLAIGPLHIDRSEHRVLVDGSAVDLTPTEFQLVVFLARHAGQVVSRQEVARAVWGNASMSSSRSRCLPSAMTSVVSSSKKRVASSTPPRIG